MAGHLLPHPLVNKGAFSSDILGVSLFISITSQFLTLQGNLYIMGMIHISGEAHGSVSTCTIDAGKDP